MSAKTNGVLMLEGNADSRPPWRRGEELVDALAYVDEISEKERAEVELLIRKEAARGDKKIADYLAELPAVPESRLGDHPVLKAELKRVASGEAMAPMDTSRYALPIPPVNRRQDANAWRHSLENAQAQLEHQYTRLLNLELMVKYGPNVWRSHNAGLDGLLKSIQTELEAVRAETEEVNKQRKLFQLDLQKSLDQLEREWYERISKNLSIEREVHALQSQMEAVQRDKLEGNGPEVETARGD